MRLIEDSTALEYPHHKLYSTVRMFGQLTKKAKKRRGPFYKPAVAIWRRPDNKD